MTINRTVSLSKKQVICVQKATAISSFVLSVVCVMALLLGIIPFYSQASTALNIIFNVFKIFEIFSKSFWYCVCCVAYSVAYVVFAIKSIKELFVLLKLRRHWMLAHYDGEYPRKTTITAVSVFNLILFRMLVLLSVSFVIDSFRLSITSWILISALLVCNFLVNFLKVFYLKRNIAEGMVASASTALLVVAFLLFLFNISNVEITALFRQIENAFRLFVLKNSVSIEYVLETVVSQIMLPVFHLFVVFSMLALYYDCSVSEESPIVIQESSKKYFIRNVIVVAIIVLLKAFVSRSTQTSAIIQMLLMHLEFVLLNLGNYFLSKSTGTCLPDAPFEEDVPNVPNDEEDKNQSGSDGDTPVTAEG